MYNSDGIRTEKVSGGVTTKYLLDGTKIPLENRGGNIISYYYDANGTRIAFKYNGAIYFYVYNLQGDVTHILNSSKSVVGTYEYDAWGKITNLSSLTSIAQINPFRYRGYYYDTESNLYYLNSRYYNPEIGRFINADSILDNRAINSINLFSYCGNNPVNNADSDGHLLGAVVGAAIGGVIGGIGGAISAAVNKKSIIAGIATGATSGAIIGAVCGSVADAVSTGGLSVLAGAAISMGVCGLVGAGGNVSILQVIIELFIEG